MPFGSFFKNLNRYNVISNIGYVSSILVVYKSLSCLHFLLTYFLQIDIQTSDYELTGM